MHAEKYAEPPWFTIVLMRDAQRRRHVASCLATHPAFGLAGEFGTLDSVRSGLQCRPARIDALVTDLVLPDGEGSALIECVCRQWPGCDGLVLSGADNDDDAVLRSIEAGATGVLPGDATPDEVVQALLEVKAGASLVPTRLARRLLQRWRHGSVRPVHGGRMPDLAERTDADAHIRLSRRESQVLDLIARGYSYAEIARLGSMSLGTVQTHIKHLYSKLSVHSRSEAVFEASQMGLLDAFRDGA